MGNKRFLVGCMALMMAGVAVATENVMTVHANKITSDISPTMYGLFFEDINFGADGGLYAELVKTDRLSLPKILWGGIFLEMLH